MLVRLWCEEGVAALGEERGTGGGGVEGVLEGVEKASVGVGFSGIGGDAAADMGEMVVKGVGGLSECLQRFGPGGRGWFSQEGFDEGVALGQERWRSELFSVGDRQELVVESGDLGEERVHQNIQAVRLAGAFAVDTEQDALEAGLNDVFLTVQGAENGVYRLEALGSTFLEKDETPSELFDAR